VIDPVATGPSPLPLPIPTRRLTPTAHHAPDADVPQGRGHQPVSARCESSWQGRTTFVDLTSAKDIPLGSTIDVKERQAAAQLRPEAGGTPQTATFFGGIFKVTQPGAITNLQLNESLASCAKAHSSACQEEAEDAPPLGQRLRLVPHPGQVQRGHVPGTEMARAGRLLRDADQGQARAVVSVPRQRSATRPSWCVPGTGYLARPHHMTERPVRFGVCWLRSA